MARVPITIMGYQCERCAHEWIPRSNGGIEPKVCPKCKSPYWNQPRNRPNMTYEEFRDRVKAVLLGAGQPLTWTEIRTRARLPQKYPNNQWVRRMEADLPLVRDRSTKGTIFWRIP